MRSREHITIIRRTTIPEMDERGKMSDRMDARKKLLIAAISWTVFSIIITTIFGYLFSFILLTLILIVILWLSKKVIRSVLRMKWGE